MAGFLKKAINDNPDVKRTIDGPSGFKIKARWLPPALRRELSDLRLELKKKKLTTNHEAIARFMAKHVIEGWENLTEAVFYGSLKIFIEPEYQDEAKQIFADNGGCFPYSREDAEMIFLNAVPSKFADLIYDDIDAYDEEDTSTKNKEDRKSA